VVRGFARVGRCCLPGIARRRSASVSPVAAVTELTTERIAQAALDVADTNGAAGFTMRAVADVLGVTPMALYHYVEDKAGLVALLVDAAISDQPLPAPTGSWVEDLWAVAEWMRNNTLAHPAVARLRNEYNVWTSSIFPMTERWLSVWQQSGLDLDAALQAATISSVAIIGFVNSELLLQETKPPNERQLASFPAARLVFKTTRNPAHDFEQMVRALIAGLHDQSRQSEGGRPTAARTPASSRKAKAATRRAPPARRAKS
jgi:AcrR family transcriptional regulator